MYIKIPKAEYEERSRRVLKLMEEKDLDGLVVYFNEYYRENGRYLSNYWPQVESGAVIMVRSGRKILAGGPEGQPYAREMSVIPDIRNVPEFMVEGEEYPGARIETLKEIFNEISGGQVQKCWNCRLYRNASISISLYGKRPVGEKDSQCHAGF